MPLPFSLHRSRQVIDDFRISFSSSDFFCLSKSEKIQANAIRWIKNLGLSQSRSPLVFGGYTKEQEALEKKLADFFHSEKAVLFPSSFQCNSTIFEAFFNTQDWIQLDRDCHKSLLQGIQLCGARWSRYRENQTKVTQKKISAWVTESIFSMSGREPNWQWLIQQAQESSSKIILDEAHSVGIFGPSGRGHGVDFLDKIRWRIIGLGKAFGLQGGAWLGRNKDLRILENKCAGLIYSTGLSPAMMGGLEAVLEIMPTLDSQRKYLFETSEWFRNELVNFKIGKVFQNTGPLVFLESEDLNLFQKISDEFMRKKILVPFIRYPTVPSHKNLFRFSLNIETTKNHLQEVLDILQRQTL